MAFARTRLPRSTCMPAGVSTWASLTTHEPFGCGPATYFGYGTDWPAASVAEPSPVASRPASGRRRLIRDLFRELFRDFRDMCRPPPEVFSSCNRDRPCDIGVERNSGDMRSDSSRQSLQV